MTKEEAVLRWKSRWSVSLQRLGYQHYKLYRGLAEGVEFSPGVADHQKLDLGREAQLLLWLGREIKTNKQLRKDLQGALVERTCFNKFEEIFND